MLIARKEAETMKQPLERMEDDIMLNASTKENKILKQNAGIYNLYFVWLYHHHYTCTR